MNSGQWSNLLRKTAITANFYFPSEEESVCVRQNLVSVNSIFVMFAVVFIWKRVIIIGFIQNNSAEQFESSQLSLHNIRPEVR